ncbi:MAG: MarR family transcriptional regulator [Lachnospiraceae bacterium]|jgi:DNA-binding MarR family transcriptional regulator|nr:MarR family transcriptional regulator [Lachnospiraceae bacterium]
MDMQNEKSVLTPKEINARNQHRETAYVHTMETEKRHELLFVDYGVNFSFFRTIAYLMAHPEGAAPSQIADELLILRQSMTNIVDTMEGRGLVERLADPKDRRRIRVRLLPQGQSLGAELLAVEEDYIRRISKYISNEERASYHELEQKMYEAKMAALSEILAERKA